MGIPGRRNDRNACTHAFQCNIRSDRHLATFHVDAFQRGSYLPGHDLAASHLHGVTPTPQIRATFHAITDCGRTRDHNEDTFLVADLATAEPLRITREEAHELTERGMLYLVADGMGGAAAGELASEMAAVEIHRHMVETWRIDRDSTSERFTQRLRESVERANQLLHNYARENPEVRGMGTTVTVAGVWRDRLYLAQIGDSRGYLVRDGEARQLTRDQSLTQRLVEVGELTEEEAEASERRNIILQALGPDPRVNVDLSWQSLQRGDVLIICSDGLSTVVRRDDIATAVREMPDIERLAQNLVSLANERGGPDNITVVVVRFDGDGLPDSANDEPGYHELLTTNDRPGLGPTLAFPAVPVPPAFRRKSNRVALAVLAVAVAVFILTVVLNR